MSMSDKCDALLEVASLYGKALERPPWLDLFLELVSGVVMEACKGERSYTTGEVDYEQAKRVVDDVRALGFQVDLKWRANGDCFLEVKLG